MATDSKNMDFPFNESCANNLKTVKESLSANTYDTVDLKVKIVTKSPKKQPIIINSTTKYKSDSLVADETGTPEVVLWEEMIDKIQTGQSYHIKKLQVRIFDDKKYYCPRNKRYCVDFSIFRSEMFIHFKTTQSRCFLTLYNE